MIMTEVVRRELRREQEKELQEELFIECPVPESNDEPIPETPTDDIAGDRGVAILDFDV